MSLTLTLHVGLLVWCTKPKGSYSNTLRSKKGSEKVLGRVPENGSQKGSEKEAFLYGFYSIKKGSEKGSQKGF